MPSFAKRQHAWHRRTRAALATALAAWWLGLVAYQPRPLVLLAGAPPDGALAQLVAASAQLRRSSLRVPTATPVPPTDPALAALRAEGVRQGADLLAWPGSEGGLALALRRMPARLSPPQPWLRDTGVILAAFEAAPLTLTLRSARDREAASAAARGLGRYAAGDWPGAVASLSGPLDSQRPGLGDSNRAALLRWRALALLRQGQLAQARGDLSAAAAANPADGSAYGLRGMLAILDGNPIAAASDYGTALDHGLTWPEIFFARGLVLQLTSNETQASADYSAALRQRPEYARALTRRGIISFYAGNYPGAIADFDAALRSAPDDVEAYGFRAEAHRARGELALAIADYEQVAQRRPDDAEALTRRSRVYAQGGDLARAQRDRAQASGLYRRALLRESVQALAELRLSTAAERLRQFLALRQRPASPEVTPVERP